MARKSAKIPAKAAVETMLAVSELRVRLEFLERENQKLLGKIEKKRTELNNFLDRIRELSLEVAQRSAPVLQKMLELDRQIHAVFTEIFTGRKLGKQTRKQIESIYANLQATGLISPNADRSTSAADDFFTREDDGDEAEQEWREWNSANRFAPESPQIDRDELKKIRQIFLRLAEVFHPDKVTDPDNQKYHTEVMQEINQAYQSGDLATLLAIEQKHQMGEIIDRNNENDLTRRCTSIERENEFLTSQFDQLKRELSATKKTQLGSMVAEYRKLAKTGCDPITEMVAETEMQVQTISEVYEFVLGFRDRRITIKDFMKGPPIFQQMQQQLADEFLLELLGL